MFASLVTLVVHNSASVHPSPSSFLSLYFSLSLSLCLSVSSHAHKHTHAHTHTWFISRSFSSYLTPSYVVLSLSLSLPLYLSPLSLSLPLSLIYTLFLYLALTASVLKFSRPVFLYVSPAFVCMCVSFCLFPFGVQFVFIFYPVALSLSPLFYLYFPLPNVVLSLCFLYYSSSFRSSMWDDRRWVYCTWFPIRESMLSPERMSA